MTEKILKAMYGSPDRPLRIGDIEITCYVLEDGTRVISQRGLQTGIGMSASGGSKVGEQRVASFVDSLTSKGLATKDLSARIRNPIRFVPTGGGRSAYGYEATILADLCDVVLDARNKGDLLQQQQKHIAEQCEILLRGFARIGIIALVDEATGYQEIRDRLALQAILDKYLRKELAAWAKRFPDEFYEQMFRLKGWQWHGMKVNRPSVVGKYTNDIVYERLAPGLLKELRARNPKDESGQRKAKHHQWFTADIGHPALAQHLHAVIGFMRASSAWDSFYRLMQRAFPKKGHTIELPLGD